MPTNQKSLDREELQSDLIETTFSTTPRNLEKFGIEVELIPVRFGSRGDVPGVPAPVPFHGEPDHGEPGTVPIVEAYAKRTGRGMTVPIDGTPPIQPAEGAGGFSFEPGGQIEYSSSACDSPAEAYAETARTLDGLTAELLVAGIDRVACGSNPWHSLDQVPLQARGARYLCMDEMFRSIGLDGPRMMRLTATVHVNIDLGSPVRAPLRWKAAQLLAPIFLATFASSPLAEGRSVGYRSVRGLIWSRVDPTRCGTPRAFIEDPETSAVAQYLDFALESRLMLVRFPDRWIPQTRPMTFAQWMEHGIDRNFPTLDDWRYHLTTLFPEVRPKGFLELRSADGPGRAFWSVPLTFWTALLCDDGALTRTLDRLLPTAGDLEERMRNAARDGLSDPDLGDDARYLFGLAADATLNFPPGFISSEMKRAFLTFGERFTTRGRSPGDEILDLFLEHGGLTRDGWRGMQDDWCSEVGIETSVS